MHHRAVVGLFLVEVAVAAETADKMPDAGATAGVGVAGQQLTPCDCAVTVPASSFLAVLVISCDGSMEQSGGGATTPQAKVGILATRNASWLNLGQPRPSGIAPFASHWPNGG